MKNKMSKLAKMVLPFLASAMIAGAAYGKDNTEDYNSLVNEKQSSTELVEKEDPKRNFLGINLPNFLFPLTIYGSPPVGGSYHFGDRDSYNINEEGGVNENNHIWGVGVNLSENWEIYGKVCRNSPGYFSKWIGAKWRFLESEHIDLGLTPFIVDGYPQNDFNFAPGFAGTVNIKWENWGLNFYIMPPRKYAREGSNLPDLKTMIENIPVLVWDFSYKFQ